MITDNIKLINEKIGGFPEEPHYLVGSKKIYKWNEAFETAQNTCTTHEQYFPNQLKSLVSKCGINDTTAVNKQDLFLSIDTAAVTGEPLKVSKDQDHRDLDVCERKAPSQRLWLDIECA